MPTIVVAYGDAQTERRGGNAAALRFDNGTTAGSPKYAGAGQNKDELR